MYYFDDPEEWTYAADQQAVLFYVNVHDLLYRCIVTRKALEERYGYCEEPWLVLQLARDNADNITGQLGRVLQDTEFRNKDGMITLDTLD